MTLRAAPATGTSGVVTSRRRFPDELDLSEQAEGGDMVIEQVPVYGHGANRETVLQAIALAVGVIFIAVSFAGVSWLVGLIGVALVALNAITIGGSMMERRDRA